MATGSLLPPLKAQFFDSNGNPLSGGTVIPLIAGTTSTPAPTYTDFGLGTQNPATISLNARGEANIWLSSDFNYKFILNNTNGDEIYTTDNVVPVGGVSSGGAFKVKVNAADPVGDHLFNKFSFDDNINAVVNILPTGYTIGLSSTNDKVKVGALDTEGFLFDKLSEGANINLVDQGGSVEIAVDVATLPFLKLDGTSVMVGNINVGNNDITNIDRFEMNLAVAPFPYGEGKLTWNPVDKTMDFQTGMADVTLQVGQELLRLIQSDANLLNGTVVKVTGYDGTSKVATINVVIANDINDAYSTLGFLTQDATEGNLAFVTSFGRIRDVDTSGTVAGMPIYLSDTTAGEWTQTRPLSPSYVVNLGSIEKVDASTGIIYAHVQSFNGSATSSSVDGMFNGMVLNTALINFVIDGGVTYADISNQEFPTKKLPVLINNEHCFLDTLGGAGVGGAARIALVDGLISAISSNFINLVVSTPGVCILAVNSTEFPTDSCPIGQAGLLDQTSTNADNVLIWRRHNNSIAGKIEGEANGIVKVLLDRMRLEGAKYISGVEQTLTIDTGPTPDHISLTTAAGVVAQLRVQNYEAQTDVAYYVVNDPVTPYKKIDGLEDITTDALGNSLLVNNRRFRVNAFGIQNSDGVGGSDDRIFLMLPNGYYTSDADALADVANTSITSLPAECDGTPFRLAVAVLQGNASNNYTNVLGAGGFIDERGLPMGGSAGGAAAGVGANDQLRISIDDTNQGFGEVKIVVGSSGNLVRTILNPAGNEQLEIEMANNISLLNIDCQNLSNSGVVKSDFYTSFTNNTNIEVSAQGSGIIALLDSVDFTGSNFDINGGVLRADQVQAFTTNADFNINPNGTGEINLKDNVHVTGFLSATVPTSVTNILFGQVTGEDPAVLLDAYGKLKWGPGGIGGGTDLSAERISAGKLQIDGDLSVINGIEAGDEIKTKFANARMVIQDIDNNANTAEAYTVWAESDVGGDTEAAFRAGYKEGNYVLGFTADDNEGAGSYTDIMTINSDGDFLKNIQVTNSVAALINSNTSTTTGIARLGLQESDTVKFFFQYYGSAHATTTLQEHTLGVVQGNNWIDVAPDGNVAFGGRTESTSFIALTNGTFPSMSISSNIIQANSVGGNIDIQGIEAPNGPATIVIGKNSALNDLILRNNSGSATGDTIRTLSGADVFLSGFQTVTLVNFGQGIWFASA